MIRKYHNHKLQANPWHREEEPHNNHKTPERQTNESNQLSHPHQDDCKTRMYIKLCTIKHRIIADPHNGSNNKQQVIFALDSAVVEVQKMFSSHGTLLSIALYYLGEKTLIKLLTHYDETKKRAHDSQIVRVNENLKLSKNRFEEFM